MKSFATILAATAASAAVAAAITLPAGADDNAKQPPRDEGAALNACLNKQGVAVPEALRGIDLKTWIGDRESDPAVRTALDACAGPSEPKAAPEDLVACLRQHGLNRPTDLAELKQWTQQQSEATLKACDLVIDGKDKAEHGCASPAPGAKAEAAKRGAAARHARRAAASARQ
jgi:hypothetical protein